MLGIKIVNVSIKEGKVVLYGRRNRRRFVITINSNSMIVTNDSGKIITEIELNYPMTTYSPIYDYEGGSGGTTWTTMDTANTTKASFTTGVPLASSGTAGAYVPSSSTGVSGPKTAREWLKEIQGKG